MGIVFLSIIGIMSGFILFSKVIIIHKEGTYKNGRKVSVIIPARNEEKNLPHLLKSLKEQAYKPYEIIVVDDFSEDSTSEIAKVFGAKVIKNKELPQGWTGKNWALWNGFLESSGDVLIFLDADVRLSPFAIESLVKEQAKVGGAISVIPYHYTEKFYERLALIANILGIFAFTSPFERKSPKGLYGSCIVVDRENYEKVKGHYSVKGEILDDLNLGKKFSDAKINIKNFIGYDLVSFRMYPYGIISEIHGFSKGAILSANTLSFGTIFLIVLWLLGLVLVGFITPFLVFSHSPIAIFYEIGYLFYTLQILYFTKYTGRFGIFIPIFHFISTAFFILIILHSFYQVAFKKKVLWKGREISVGRRNNV
ncbi:Glycosyltransferase involved in cell wall bisynthesis [Thermoanaerobacter uzonensis DSM 18761]|jgi:glycosyltransferase involved in cell wall biosynthesis|uniref:4,4'-diaponeurosporenoate glycosyltransferase n=1 Tax=Thermoanaerobacter uzonensis DSM 18761 TaxID=1123369 RepID=A0A1M4WIR8_9THEO|nr:glycosyltransferase family 2 protein [Thermoanaerobacter uzonensis]SHE81191.1 Glycosyltransferase involved in cell wall bisynthesis [Thermoanaerobacter uzonensis DSM 18761]